MKLNPTQNSFIVIGFSDWKNALSRFKIHESSRFHHDSVYVISQQSKSPITTQLFSTMKRQQEQRRAAFSIQISCIVYLLRQGLALRGHIDEESNLIQLLKLRCDDNNFLQEWIDEKRYLSHDIVNEICKEIYLAIIRDVVKEVFEHLYIRVIQMRCIFRFLQENGLH